MSNLFLCVSELNLISVAYRIVLATLIGGLIGIERSKHGRAAGLRTHILVCVGSCLAAMLGIYMYEKFSQSVDPTRIAAQIIASIGVLGAGSILIKNRELITGLTTAAGMWSTSIIGLALGFGFYEGAIICALITTISIAFLNFLESDKKNEILLYTEINNPKKMNEFIGKINESNLKFVSILPPKSNIEGNIGIHFKTTSREKIDEIIKSMLEINYVVYCIKE